MSKQIKVGTKRWATGLLAGSMVLVAGCATKPAPEYGGRWKAVNRYAEVPREIPLQQVHAFYPSPMDGTLKAMLERWGRDAKMQVSYQHPSDFTLHSAIADIRTNDLSQALALVSSAYAGQGVGVSVDDNRIVVRARQATQDAAAAMP